MFVEVGMYMYVCVSPCECLRACLYVCVRCVRICVCV